MATGPMNVLIRHLRRVALSQDEVARRDGQLLDAFIEQRDEAAFAALVRRHGPLVLGVCRRVLRHHHDAEDACQATFLVLARKASSVRPREMVANWLHGVAYRTALKARTMTMKRQSRERQMTEMPEPEVPPHDPWHDLQPLLDQELNGLPETYRLPILLCDLEGKSIKEAIRQLGWPQGTVAGRLARGRKMLAKRLARRGLVFSGGSLAALLSQKAVSAAAPTSLVSSTVQAARLMAAGQMAIAGVVPAKVGALMEGVMKAMLITKLKTVSAVLLMLGMCTLAGGLLTRPTAAQQVAAEKPPAEGRKGGEATKSEPPARVRNAETKHAKQGRVWATADSPVTPSYVVEPPDVLLVEAVVERPKATSQFGYECLVRPDGTIALGANGTVKVAGRSLDQIRTAIVDHLTPKAGDNAKVEVQVNVIRYNSKVYYVIVKRKAGDMMYRFLDTGGETVVAAILRVDGLAASAVKGRVWVDRPLGERREVNWQAITQQGKTDTNYLLRAGDRVFVEEPLPE